MEEELTDAQLEQIDAINHAAYNAVASMLDFDPEWDAEWIGPLSDKIADICVRYFGKTEMEVYPYIEREE